MLHRKHVDSKGNWVTFRPDIKIMDCTIRDVGLMNSHQFDETFVKAVYDTCAAAGVDYCELATGVQAHLRAWANTGQWKFCDEDMLRRIVGEDRARCASRSWLTWIALTTTLTFCQRQERHRLRAGGLLHQPDPGRGRHDQGRPRQGLRNHAQT